MAGPVFAGLSRIFANALGEEVQYTPQGGVTSTVQGVYTTDHYVALEGDGAGVSGTKAAVSLQQTDCPNAAAGDRFIIQSATYEAADIQPDGKGMVTFILELI